MDDSNHFNDLVNEFEGALKVFVSFEFIMLNKYE
jgi:hypothetical protein